MGEENKYDVYIDGEREYEDIEASSEADAIEQAQELFCIEKEDDDIDFSDYKFKAMIKF